jgi:cytosine/adenosine deaminase-related metal-dependent hydrolase
LLLESMIIRARTVVTMDGPPIENGAVATEGNRIQAVGPFADLKQLGGEVLDLGEQILLPGLINAHCHLDYTMMRRAIAAPKSFTAWVQRINALKRSLDSEDYLKAIARGFAELQQWGTTSVCNIEAFPELMPRLPASPIRTWWFYEMIDVRHRVTTEDVVAGALSFFHHRANSLDSFGLSPHAPYTASVELYQLANDCASTFTMPLTTHVGESAEEFAMFREAQGPLFEFMESLQRPMSDCGTATPFALLWESGAVHGGWILAHMNELAKVTLRCLRASRGQRAACRALPVEPPYFAHRVFRVAAPAGAGGKPLRRHGQPREHRFAEPARGVAAIATDRTVTLAGAALAHDHHESRPRALQRSHQLGRLVPGALADMIALPGSGNAATALEEIVAFEQPIPWMMIDGEHRA